MQTSFRHVIHVIAAALAAGFAAGQVRAQDDLSPDLEEHLGANPKLPSLSAVVVVDGRVAGAGAAGVRRKGDDTPVTIDDKYHIGSCTKAFTATLAAKLVEQGKISWDATIGETLRNLKPHEGFRSATLKQLVSNTGGFPKEIPASIWKNDAWGATGDPDDQREHFAEAMLSLEPRFQPGTKNEYSNTGFTMAGVMLERTARKSWEELIRREIFDPLAMESAGFYGPAGEARKPDQPWGHQGNGEPVPPGRGADNPPAIAPAGAIHCSMPDLMKWVAMHLNRETGPVVEEAATYEVLHTPVIGDYAFGWLVAERGWANGKALTHMGSNTMYTTVIWFAPARKFAVVVATNIGQDVAAQPCDELIGNLIENYLR
ncbi:MAG: serine hydrolase domain-containing protein [Verrucomicrobiales bacterium]